jgi:hypothetical protein
MDSDAVRLQCFVDDPIAVIRGTEAEIRNTIGVLLLFWAALGLRFAYSKAAMGVAVPWIGALVSVNSAVKACPVSVPQQKTGYDRREVSELLEGTRYGSS